MTTAVMIPARIGSSRFPAKMLAKVDDEHTLIERVFLKVCEQWTQKDVFVVTDSQEIADLFHSDNVIMTSEDCPNGTARCSEAASNLDPEYDFVINVQGDMIDIPDGILFAIEEAFDQYDLITVTTDMPEEMQNDPNTVKCITDYENRALWFARGIEGYGDWHLGIYGYFIGALLDYNEIPESDEEKKESLEQLRFLKNGYNMYTVHTIQECAEINTPEDLERWQSTQMN